MAASADAPRADDDPSPGSARPARARQVPLPELDRTVCTPCRGTGKVISGLGGEPHSVDCPWCEGTGIYRAGHDAQNLGPRP